MSAGPVIWRVCLMRLASAGGLSSQLWPEADAVVASPPLPACLHLQQVAQSYISIALLFLALKKKTTKATDSNIPNYLYKDKCVKMQIVHSSLDALMEVGPVSSAHQGQAV